MHRFPANLQRIFLANYVIPAEGEESPFKEITFTDLQREDAAKLIETYNKVNKIPSGGRVKFQRKASGPPCFGNPLT